MRYVKLLLVVLTFTVPGHAAQPKQTTMPGGNGEALRLVVLDAAGHPLAGARIELGKDIECVTFPCPPMKVTWAQKSGPDGSVMIPRQFIHRDTLVGTRGYEPRAVGYAKRSKDGKRRVIRLMGHGDTWCSRDGFWVSILLADDRRSALASDDEIGLMPCEEGKDVFLTCHGPQIPGDGVTAYFTRSGDSISVRLVRGPWVLLQADCYHLPKREGIPRDLNEWILELSLFGGSTPQKWYLHLNQAGELDVWSDPPGHHVTAQASAQVMAKITDFLKVAQKVGPSHTPGPDEPLSSLALITGGSKYKVAIPEDIGSLLAHTLFTTLK